jgi:glutamate 5-kinase
MGVVPIVNENDTVSVSVSDIALRRRATRIADPLVPIGNQIR